MQGSTSLQKTPPRSHFLTCTLPPIRSSPTDCKPTPFLPPFFPSSEISSFWGTSIAIILSGTQKVLLTLVGRKYSTGSSFLTSSPSIILTYLPFSIAPLHCFAPSSLALFFSWEVLQDLGFDHLPILLSVPLSSVFCPNYRPTFFNFPKAHWDDFASYFDSHCSSAEEYSSLSLSSAAIFTSLALNAAKSFIPLGRLKPQPKA